MLYMGVIAQFVILIAAPSILKKSKIKLNFNKLLPE